MTKARDLANAATALSAVDATELAFVDGVTSAIQTQMDAKAPSSTAVTLTGTQTLTNKTLTNPVIASVVNNTLTTAKGDIISATAASTPAPLAVGNNGETLVADSSTSTGLRYTAGTVQSNPVLNSAFQIWQRGTSNVTTSLAYTADRWQKSTATHYGISRQTTSDTTNLPFIQYCARVQRTAASTSTTVMEITQSVESVNSIPFAGKTVTMSFYARAGANYSPTSNSLTAILYTSTSTDGNVLAGPWANAATPVGGYATLTTTWQRFSFTGTLASNITQFATFFSATPTGTAGANDYYEVTGVQVDIGSVALPFRTYAATIQGELAACMRYYQKSFGYATTPANNSGETAGPLVSPNYIRTGTYEPSVQIVLPVPMRAAATATLYNLYTGTSGQWSDGSTVTANARVLQSGPKTFYADNTDVLMSFTNGNIHYTLDAEL
jgi:hypothetical protein